MNIYAIIILSTLIFSLVLNFTADILNLSALKRTLPNEFDGVYTADEYARSQDYTRTKTRFGLITAFFDFILISVFWFSGGFNHLDEFIRSQVSGSLKIGLIYIATLVLVKSLISLPFGIYSTFVIEERYGFNRTTIKTFITDLIKGLLLSIVIGLPLLAGIILFFEYFKNYAWLVCWGAVTAFTLVLQFIAPTWIMPLFNKFTPLDEGELKSAILTYAKSVAFSVQNIFVIDGSKRSSKSNAFFTGFGRNKRIALYDTLIEKHTVPELTSILAHEIGHYKKKHIIQGTFLGIIQTGAVFFLLSIFLTHRGLFDAFYMTHTSIHAGLIFFGLLYAPVDMILSLILQIISRKNEFEADRYALDTYKNPNAMIESFKKLSVHNLSNLTPHPAYVFLHYSHPPVLERIRALKNRAV